MQHAPARRRLALTILGLAACAGLALLATGAIAPRGADAQVPPYKAWGSGRTSGEVIRAFKGSAQVGQVTVSAAGTWEFDIFAGGAANVTNGDSITFTVDGRAAAESVIFSSGQFALPPGLTLTTATPAPTPAATPAPTERGRITGTPIFDSTGRALAVFTGGTVDQLATAASASRATGVWVQDRDGIFQLYIVGGPAFVADQFRARFPDGFPGVTSVMLVR
ncbi:MAG: hypothetical protein WC273_08175 [Dehalococcoidia bacterium]